MGGGSSNSGTSNLTADQRRQQDMNAPFEGRNIGQTAYLPTAAQNNELDAHLGLLTQQLFNGGLDGTLDKSIYKASQPRIFSGHDDIENYLKSIGKKPAEYK
jgi:hypothetical protein